MRLSEIPVGGAIDGRLYLVQSEIRTGKNDSKYLRVTLSDGEESLSGNVWNWTGGALPPGVYDATGNVSEYQGARQVSNVSLERSADQDASAFVLRYAPPKEEDVRSAIEALVASIRDDGLRRIVEDVLAPRMDAFLRVSSAAHVHHVGATGGAYHTLEVARVAEGLCSTYAAMGYPVDRDLAAAGALLHDVGKIYAYESKPGQVSMTMEGQLLEHTVMGVMAIHDAPAAKEYPHAAMLLQHLVASHHEIPEYGAAVRPKCLEAVIVATADRLSKDMGATYDAMRKPGGDAGFTDKVWSMENTRFLRPERVESMLADDCQVARHEEDA